MAFRILIGIVVLGFIAFLFIGRITTYHPPYYKLKRMQQDAKSALLGLYTTEMAFRMDFHTFTTSLYGLGMGCLKDVSYNYGFLLPSQNSEATSIVKVANYDVNKMSCDRTNGADLETVRSYCSDCNAGQDKFKAVAWTRLPNNKLDIWTIDENKKLVNVLNGVDSAP
ncbi:MAG TPA: hypothetical protein VN132_08545 [Bdellovibrio sp.]|nr:hypothetical protein [Bdellovibrio sp.]